MPETDNTFHLPAAFLSRLNIQYGSHSADLIEALTDVPVTSVRINPLKWKHPPDMEPIPWSRYGYYLKSRPSFTLDPWLHAGLYYVQEAGSMLLEQAFKAIPSQQPRQILDLCGAPGGKSTHLLSLLSDGDVLVSNEVIRSRAVILQENLQKWGHDNVIVSNNDPRAFSDLSLKFDVIVADVPCSGEGLFRKDRSSVEEWSPGNAILCAARQKRILTEAWKALKPGGYLIYSTCTFNPEENEENLHWLTEQYDAESVEIPADPLWKLNRIEFRNIVGYQTLPGISKAEGFFIGLLRKNELAESSFKKQKSDLKSWIPVRESEFGNIRDWLMKPAQGDFVIKSNIIHYMESNVRTLLSGLNGQLKILQAGLPVAEIKGRDHIPLQPLASSIKLNSQHFGCVELNLEDAVKYLRKDNLRTDSAKSGWTLASYRGVPLGWMKNLGNRINNYYPKEWRIRMSFSELPAAWHEVSD